MPRTSLGLKIMKRGLRILHLTDRVPRLSRSRQAKALIDAIQRGDSDLALWLLKRGSDANAKDSKGRSALWWAAAECRTSVIRELLKRGATLPDDVLIGPVAAGDLRAVRALVQQGANVNCVGSTYSPVGHHHIKQVLLTIALGTASLNPKLESIPILLIRAGATVNRWILPKPLPGLENRSMIGLAAYHGLHKTVQAMIAAGADVNLRDSSGRTALFDACLQGHRSVAKMLLRAGARIDATDRTGLTPLEAVRQQERSLAMAHSELRISAGVNVDKRQLDAERAAWREQRARTLALLESRQKGR